MSASSEEVKPDIYLFDAESVLYAYDGVRKNNPYLKTYRHKDEEDVPYVDVNEFRSAFRGSYTDYKVRGFKRLEDGIFILYSPAGGETRFDVKNQVVIISNYGKMNYDFNHINDEAYLDPCLEWRYLKGSNKTKYVIAPTPVTIDLAKYNLKIIEQDHHLYAPLSLVNHLIVRPHFRSVAYNGRDYFVDNLLGDAGLARAYSGKNGACISMQKSKFSRCHFTLSEPKEGEAYRFISIDAPSNFGKPTTCDLVFKTDGTCFAKTNDNTFMPTFDFVGTWNKDGADFIDFALKPSEDGVLSPISDTIDLSDRTYYRVKERTLSMAKAHYYDLCLDFDYLYGEKSFHGYASADEFFDSKGFKVNLLSHDNATYYDALSRLLMGEDFADSHVTLRNEGFGSLDYKRNLGEYSSYAGKRKKDYDAAVGTLGGVRASYEGYQVSGETASIFLPTFMGAYREGQSKSLLENVYTGDEEKKMERIGKAAYNDILIGLGYFLNDISKNPSIKNVVFDVSGNLGGYVMWVPYVMAVMTDDPYLSYLNSVDGSIVEAHYQADLDGDGVFGGPKDTFKGKYSFYIATYGASYSAGNILPAMAKVSGSSQSLQVKSPGSA